MSRNATVWRSSRRRALRGGRSRVAGKTKERLDFIKPVVKSSSLDGLDPEVISWIYRVDTAGGSTDQITVNALNSWIKKINATPGLRGKLKRVNLFCGDNLNSALTPLITDVGLGVDTGHNFVEEDYLKSGNLTGLKDRSPSEGTEKYIDTGLDFESSGIQFNDGHLAINSMGPALDNDYAEWAGRSWASMGSSFSSGKHHFRWGKTFLELEDINPQQGAATGFYLGQLTQLR